MLFVALFIRLLRVGGRCAYDLSINKYKKIEYVPVEYPPTEEILAEIEELNEEITKETAELRALLRK